MQSLITTEPLDRFLSPAPLIDVNDSAIGALVKERLAGLDPIQATRVVFYFVRDEVSHSWDIQGHRVTRSATDVLTYREGICYAKSHLFAGLLRRAQIPTGICYQRLTLFNDPSDGYAVHALNTVYLEPLGRWIRLDARGNKAGVNAQFSIADEKLAFLVRPEYDEVDYLVNCTEPHPAILETLLTNDDALVMYHKRLPSQLEFKNALT